MSGSIGFRRAALHLGGLWALAFAQPLFELLGRNAQFFVARASTTGDILFLAFGYALVPPLVGALLVWLLGRLRPVLGWGAMLVLLAFCVFGLVLPPAGDLLGGSSLALVAAAVVACCAAAVYAGAAVVRAFVTVLSPAPLIVLVLFLLVSPVRGLLVPVDPSDASVRGGPSRSSTPIVHIVLDELPTSTLIGADGEVDAERFPNFAQLARESTFYRSATTVDDLTTEAVPAQVTGENPEQGRLPTVRDHPRSLFTLFERSHDLTVVEPITDLCPARVCADIRPSWRDRLSSLRSDLWVVVRLQLLPADLRDGLPAIDRVWEGFETANETGAGELRGGSNLKRDILGRLARNDATAGFARAIASLEDRRSSRPPLLFLHSTLPHGAWRFLPDGRRYDIDGVEFPGLASAGWTGPQWQADQGFQRHVLQVQYTDRLMGSVLDALRASGRFDAAAIVVTADHGAAFVAGQPRRPIGAENAGVIAPVPFFVKLPGQRSGAVDDRAVRTTDVLPTIAAAAGVTLPWKADGMPASERPVDGAAVVSVSHAGEPVFREPLGSVLALRRARDVFEARLLRRGLYAIGPRPELIGRRVAVRSGGARRIALDPESAVIPSFVSGELEGTRAGTELAVAVNGRIEATTRVYRENGTSRYAALVPPASLRAGANAITVAEIRAGGVLRPVG